MFRIECEKALPSKCKTLYKGIAYDGCWFYLTEYCDCKIVQLDCNLNPKKHFCTCRRYTYICYDPTECCFWAATNKCRAKIYHLNSCFEEIECIDIKCPLVRCEMITGISRDCCNNTLVISFASAIIQLNPKCPTEFFVFKKNSCEWSVGVLSLCPYTICHYINGKGQTIRIYSDCGKIIDEVKVPCDLTIESAVFAPCVNKHCRCLIYVLVSKQGEYPYLISYSFKNTSLCNNICDCNYKICHKHCHDDKPHRPCDCKESCCEILESIALVETSIAHILNAEGEKIQKVVATTDDVCKMLAVNESVQNTINKATHLEYVLYDKIDALKKCCDFCGDCKHDDCDFDCCDDDYDCCNDDCGCNQE